MGNPLRSCEPSMQLALTHLVKPVPWGTGVMATWFLPILKADSQRLAASHWMWGGSMHVSALD